jgi:hypothetical protein
MTNHTRVAWTHEATFPTAIVNGQPEHVKPEPP